MPQLTPKYLRHLKSSKNKGFYKTAFNLDLVCPDISVLDWNRLKLANTEESPFGNGIDVFSNLLKTADSFESEYNRPIPTVQILNDPDRVIKLDPKKYLYSHVTIIPSVDVEKDEHTITVPTTKYINANNDAWERRVLLNSYKTFIGACNYYEHIQVPSLNKGWIIDAVARDVGDTIFIDILVATDRKHKDLCASIESKKTSMMSMGCTTSFTICSKCGNVSENDSEYCDHMKYEKGHEYKDKDGNIRKIGELCGRFDAPNSVQFIEASWVADPAFTMATIQNRIASTTPNKFSFKKAASRIKIAQPPDEPPMDEPPLDDIPEDPFDLTPPGESPDEDKPSEDKKDDKKDTKILQWIRNKRYWQNRNRPLSETSNNDFFHQESSKKVLAKFYQTNDVNCLLRYAKRFKDAKLALNEFMKSGNEDYLIDYFERKSK